VGLGGGTSGRPGVQVPQVSDAGGPARGSRSGKVSPFLDAGAGASVAAGDRM